MQIQGKVALITGGGSGIGRATALAFADKGAKHVHVVDLNEAGSDETAKMLVEKGCGATVHVCDVSDFDALTRVFDLAATATGLDIVFNNAGVVTGKHLFPETTIERMMKVFAINIDAVVYGTQLAVQHMAGKEGVVVNTVSLAATHPRYRDILYSTSKAAVLHFTSCCFQLMDSHGIRVCGVNPGLVDTPIVNTTGGDKVADWMAPVLANNVALPPSALADAVVGLVEDDGNAGVTIDVAHADRVVP